MPRRQPSRPRTGESERDRREMASADQQSLGITDAGSGSVPDTGEGIGRGGSPGGGSTDGSRKETALHLPGGSMRCYWRQHPGSLRSAPKRRSSRHRRAESLSTSTPKAAGPEGTPATP